MCLQIATQYTLWIIQRMRCTQLMFYGFTWDTPFLGTPLREFSELSSRSTNPPAKILYLYNQSYTQKWADIMQNSTSFALIETVPIPRPSRAPRFSGRLSLFGCLLFCRRRTAFHLGNEANAITEKSRWKDIFILAVYGDKGSNTGECPPTMPPTLFLVLRCEQRGKSM